MMHIGLLGWRWCASITMIQAGGRRSWCRLPAWSVQTLTIPSSYIRRNIIKKIDVCNIHTHTHLVDSAGVC